MQHTVNRQQEKSLKTMDSVKCCLFHCLLVCFVCAHWRTLEHTLLTMLLPPSPPPQPPPIVHLWQNHCRHTIQKLFHICTLDSKRFQRITSTTQSQRQSTHCMARPSANGEIHRLLLYLLISSYRTPYSRQWSTFMDTLFSFHFNFMQSMHSCCIYSSVLLHSV